MTEQLTKTNNTFGAKMELASLEDAFQFANVLLKSGMAPKGSTAESIMISVQMGYEVGLKPMASIQNIACINGRPAIWGDAIVGLVRASGEMEDYREEEVGTFPNDDYGWKCTTKRKSDKSEQTSTFTIADAKQAKIWGTNTWAKYPKRMLKLRARGYAMRDTYGDILRGLQVAEEVMDYPAEAIPASSEKYQQSDVFNSEEKPFQPTDKSEVVDAEIIQNPEEVSLEQIEIAVGLPIEQITLHFMKKGKGKFAVKESMSELSQDVLRGMLSNTARVKKAVLATIEEAKEVPQ